MALTREERKLLHQKSKQPTFGSGRPDIKEGVNSDISFRDVEGSGTVQYVKQNNEWVAISSTGEMPQNRTPGGPSRHSFSMGSGFHASLSGLTSDDHTQYLLVAGTRAMSGDLQLEGGDGALMFTVAGKNSIEIPDNQSNALVIEEADNAYLTFVTTDSSEKMQFHKELDIDAVSDFGSNAMTNVNIDSGSIDNTTIGSSSHSTIKGTTIDATTDFTIGGTVITDAQIADDGDFTIDAVGDIVLSADGDQINMDDGTTTRFSFNVDSTPELDVTGTFILDGSSDITIDSVGSTFIKTSGNLVFHAGTTGFIKLHNYDVTLFQDYGIMNKKDLNHFTTGKGDLEQNYSILAISIESSSFNTSYGS
jgi:hypothetical protein